MLRDLLTHLWEDESGAVIAAEYLMIGTIVTAGTATGMVAMRDAMVSEFEEFGQSVRDVRKAYTPPALKRARQEQSTETQQPPLSATQFVNTP